MKIRFYYHYNDHPKLEHVDTIRINARVSGEDDDIKIFKASSLAEEFFHKDECRSKEKLEEFLIGARISETDTDYLLLRLVDYVHLVSCPEIWNTTPGCRLTVWLFLEDLYNDHDDLDYGDCEIDEGTLQLWLDDDDSDDDDYDLDQD